MLPGTAAAPDAGDAQKICALDEHFGAGRNPRTPQ